MSDTVRKHAVHLKMLKDANPALRRKILTFGGNELLTCICEVCKNILNANVPLTQPQMRSLRRHKHNLRKIVLKGTPKKVKTKIIQTGGFLPAILGPIISLLGGLFSK